MKKIISLMLCLVLVVTCLVGCGKEYEYGIELKDGVNYKFYVASVDETGKNYVTDEDDNEVLTDYHMFINSKFDKKGNITEVCSYEEENGKKKLKEKIEITYDSSNFPKKFTKNIYNDIDDDYEEYEFKFDDKKRLEEIVHSNTVIKIEYDDKNRPIRALYTSKGGDDLSENSNAVLERVYDERGYTDSYNDGWMAYETKYECYSNEDSEENYREYYRKVSRVDDPKNFSLDEYTFYPDGREKTHVEYYEGNLITETSYSKHNNATIFNYSTGEKEVEKETIILENGVEIVKMYSLGEYTGCVEHTYDDHDREILRVEYDADDNVISETRYENEYWPNGEIKKVTRISENGVNYIAEYNEDGFRYHSVIEENGEVAAETFREFDETLGLIKHEKSVDGETVQETIYDYSDDGKLLSSKTTEDGVCTWEEQYDKYENKLLDYDVNGEAFDKSVYTYRAYVDDGRPNVEELIDAADNYIYNHQFPE